MDSVCWESGVWQDNTWTVGTWQQTGQVTYGVGTGNKTQILRLFRNMARKRW